MDISLQKLMVVSLRYEFRQLAVSGSKELFQFHWQTVKKAPSQCATGPKPGFYLTSRFIYWSLV